jgi:DDE superfamily endonuclease
MDTTETVILIGILEVLSYFNTIIHSVGQLDRDSSSSDGYRSVYTDANRGDRLVSELRHGAAPRLIHTTRLNPEQFEALLDWLLANTKLEDSKHVSAAEKLIIFLYICAHDTSFRGVQELVHHSTSTIHTAFTETLDAMCILHREFVKLPSSETPEVIRDSPKFYPMFKDAVGALDGTYIPISVRRRVSRDDQVPWRCRKGYLAQNVLAAVDFDMNFIYVLAGWEGSAHDSRVLRSAVSDKGFCAPPGKYYLADAGYSSSNGLCLVPYNKVRYHLREWGLANQRPENPKELFNLRHSSLRVTVERTFGVLKNRFHILNKARDGFSLITQVKIVYALTGLHNFLNKHGAEPEREWAEIEEEENRQNQSQLIDEPQSLNENEADERRTQIAEEMWELYQRELSRRATVPTTVRRLEQLEDDFR